MEHLIQFQLDLEAPIEAVWEAWTTEKGLRSFFAPACNVELRPGGPYEIYFHPDNPPGQRGADDMIVLAFQAPSMLSFTWNAPPSLPEVRPHRSHVTIRLESLAPNQTRLHFREDGYGQGGEWDQRADYFRNAWGRVVLPRLVYRFAQGPVKWDDEIDLDPYLPLIQEI